MKHHFIIFKGPRTGVRILRGLWGLKRWWWWPLPMFPLYLEIKTALREMKRRWEFQSLIFLYIIYLIVCVHVCVDTFLHVFMNMCIFPCVETREVHDECLSQLLLTLSLGLRLSLYMELNNSARLADQQGSRILLYFLVSAGTTGTHRCAWHFFT